MVPLVDPSFIVLLNVNGAGKPAPPTSTRMMLKMNELNRAGRDSVMRYAQLLAERLGSNALEIRLFGSAARGELWPESSAMRSTSICRLWPEG